MYESKVQTIDQSHLDTTKTNYFQIDFLKAIMIFLVIFDHMVAWNLKSEIGVALWERISIPVFLVILGFNMGLSLRKQEDATLKELYSRSYFKKKLIRYLVPFLILYAASTFIGLVIYDFNFEAMYYGQYYPNHGIINLFYFIMPFWGPGNWFIPVLFQSILILPLLYWGFTKKPVLTLILTFVVEILLQLVALFFIIGINGFNSWGEVHRYSLLSSSILFYLPGVGLGLWFSFGHKLTAKRNLFMWIIFPISFIYLIAYQFFDFRFMLEGISLSLLRGDYNFMVIPYSAFLVLLALRFLPIHPRGRLSKSIFLIGKSTYHILLTQILGYGLIYAMWGDHYGMGAPFNPFDLIDLVTVWIMYIWFGIMLYKIQHQKDVIRRIFYYLNFFIVFPSIMVLSYFVQTSSIPIPLLVIIIYAITALLVHYIVKKPLTTKVLGVWTGFLVICFISTILQIDFILPRDFWILLIPMGIFLAYAVYYTTTNKIFRDRI
jgi:hypothetical protein